MTRRPPRPGDPPRPHTRRSPAMQRLHAARPPHRRSHRRRGAAFVEFAVLAPFFILLVVMSLEMGACIHHVGRMGAALREAGRLASQDWDETLPGPTTPRDKIESDVLNFLAAEGFDRGAVRFAMTHADGDRAGQDFPLGDPDVRLMLFRMEVTSPTPGRIFSPAWFGPRLRAQFVFRAGRDTHSL